MKKLRFLCAVLLVSMFLPSLALALEDPAPAATAALLMDFDHDEILYEMNAHEKRYPASITKVMTALLVLEAVERGELALSDMVTADPGIQVDLSAGGSTQNIRPGETMSVEDLLYCALVSSANEACNILAYAVAGDIPSFVALMNQRAQELGMTGTHYANTHGLHNENHYSTAWDIWLVAREAMTHEKFREIVSTREHIVPPTNLSDQRHFYNTNALISQYKYLGYIYKPAIGIKTGSTPEAGYCLVSAAEQDGRTLYCVVLGAELVHQEDNSYRFMSFAESSRLLDWGFKNFSERVILEGSEPLAELTVTLSESEYVLARADGTLSALLPKDLDVTAFKQDVVLDAESVEAPVTEGQVLGKVTLSYDGREYGTLDLVALNDVERSDLLYYIDRAEKLLAQTWVKVAVAAMAALIVVLIAARSIHSNKKRRRTRSYVGSGGQRRR